MRICQSNYRQFVLSHLVKNMIIKKWCWNCTALGELMDVSKNKGVIENEFI